MKYNAKKEIVDFDGNKIVINEKIQTHGMFIANSLVGHKSNDALKCYILAQKFYQDQTVEVDMADVVLIKNALKASTLNNLVQGQILIELEDLKEDENKTKA
jgi:hypothetical protein